MLINIYMHIKTSYLVVSKKENTKQAAQSEHLTKDLVKTFSAESLGFRQIFFFIYMNHSICVWLTWCVHMVVFLSNSHIQYKVIISYLCFSKSCCIYLVL